MNTIYVIAPTSLFTPHFESFQNGEGHYFEVDFKNFGAIRYSLDGSQVLLEEMEDKFLPEHLAMEGVLIFRGDQEMTASDQTLTYLQSNKEQWINEDEI